MSKGKDLINSIKYGLYRMLTLKPGSTIGYRSTRIVPISEKSGGFYPAGFTERLYPEIASSIGWVYSCVRDCSGKPTAFRRGLGGGKPDRLRERPNPPKEKRTNILKY